MAINVYIQDQMHRNVAEVEFSDEALDDFIRNAHPGSLLRSIHRNADTMFNTDQLEFFVAELASISPKNDREASTISALRTAAESTIRRPGYLWFSGD